MITEYANVNGDSSPASQGLVKLRSQAVCVGSSPTYLDIMEQLKWWNSLSESEQKQLLYKYYTGQVKRADTAEIESMYESEKPWYARKNQAPQSRH